LLGESLLAASGRDVGSRNLGLAFGNRHMRGPNSASGTAVARRDSSLLQAPSNDRTRNIEIAGESLLGLPSKIAPDQIVAVQSVPFHGYVYNLQTSRGFYVAEGIIAHNCECAVMAA
jgi:hypothetical protein